MPEKTPPPETFPVNGFDSAANMTLYVGPSLKPGVDTAGPVMQVKETPTDDYKPFTGTIQGFNYQQGYNYQLKVRRIERFETPEGAPSVEYYLQEVVKKEPVNQSNASLPLTDTTWKLIAYTSDSGAPTPAVSNSAATMSFTDGKLSGTTGCNNYFGSYQLSGKELSFSGVGSTRMACLDDGVMEQEQAYLSALGKVASYSLNGDSLELLDGQGSDLLSFTASKS